MIKSKILIGIILLSILLPSAVFAGLDEQIDLLLEEDKASFGNVVYIILAAREAISEEDTVETAMEVLYNMNWGLTKKGKEDVILLSEFAYLLMKGFNLSGGVMYMMLPGPRYALREMIYKGIITDRPDPNRTVTGEEVMGILARVMDLKENE